MIRVVRDDVQYTEIVNVSSLDDSTPIFAVLGSVVIGMFVVEYTEDMGEYRWILRTGGTLGDFDYYDTLDEAMEDAEYKGCIFFTDIKVEKL